MYTLKKYQVIDNTSKAILHEFESKEDARNYINGSLWIKYNYYLMEQGAKNGKFVDFWRWYYLHKTGKKRNYKLYTIKKVKYNGSRWSD